LRESREISVGFEVVAMRGAVRRVYREDDMIGDRDVEGKMGDMWTRTI
jgi:hypothetical protein